MKKMLAPSLLAADFGNLASEIDKLNRSEADWLHLDIMDGVFVPNISFGFPVMKYINALSKKPLDVHLMIVEPDKFIDQCRDNGAMMMTVHYEACVHLHRTIERIHQAGMKAGVSLNPHTPIALLENIIHDVDLVLIMSVNPGFGGQKFIENTYNKIAQLRELIARHNAHALIEVDGGVNQDNAQLLWEQGADVLVAGNALFSQPDLIAAIAAMKQ